MVIQPNMSSKSIIEIWENSVVVFQKYNISISAVPLEKVVDGNRLNTLLKELNNFLGSSSATCVEGG
ncbi:MULTISPECIES: hypothetical protein [Mesobacillus]|uniref:Uncharacterized protein n=1 Tax=Mesobacillus subterraneus TaxID=285983 RepID=A0A0D6ZGE0_9BACI|nr:hypothetical protein [Mesobacillus subterraneus]KIY23698.1 hypothetical protein UB32_01620 [Mesobacillus subterraneus]